MRNSDQTTIIKQLISAIKANRDIAAISQIISGIEDINQADDNGETALHMAAQKGHTAIAKLLIDKGAKVNQVTTDGKTPLYIAALNGHVEVVAQLLEAEGVNVNQATTSGYGTGTTPLYWAALSGYEPIVKFLLAHKDINPNQARTDDGVTPLFMATEHGHESVVKLFLAHENTDPNQERTTDGATPLYWAAFKGHKEIVAKLLAVGADVNKARTTDGATPLCIAAEKGHTEVVAQLLAVERVEVNQADEYGNTPLHWAAFEGHAEVVAQLLAAGVNVNQATTIRSTPLYEAAQKGHTEVVAQLLAAGADVTQANQYGRTPLCIAAQKGHTEVVAQLLAAGADVNQAMTDGVTPLCLAARQGHAEVVAQLLAVEGVNVNKATTRGLYSGRTPLYMAAQNGHTEIVAQLLAAGADETLFSEVDQDRFKDIIAEGKKLMTDYLARVRKRAIAINQGQRSNDSNLSKLPEELINDIIELSLNVQHPSFVSDEKRKKAIKEGKDKFKNQQPISQRQEGKKRGEVTTPRELDSTTVTALPESYEVNNKTSEYEVFENKSLKQISHNESSTDLYKAEQAQYDLRIAKKTDGQSWEHKEIIGQIAKNLNQAFNQVVKTHTDLDKTEFIQEVIKFAQTHGGVGNASEFQNEIKNFVAAKEFSYHYQKISKESGVYTGRSDNFKEVGARLKRIPPELTAEILGRVEASIISVKML